MFSDFLFKNWFDLLQTAFIIIGFILTYRANRSDVRSSKVDHLLSLSQSYREIWNKTYSQPELLRIKEKDVDLEKHPITEAEQRMVKETILHIYAVYIAIENKQLDKGEMEKDISKFLQLPIPNAVWNEVRGYYPKRFVSFVDSLLK